MKSRLKKVTVSIGVLLLTVGGLPACGGGNDAEHTATWCDLTVELSTQRLRAERQESAGGPGPGADPDLAAVEERVREHGWPEGLQDAGAVIEKGVPFPEDEEWQAHYEAVQEMVAFAKSECDFDPATEELVFGSGDT